MIAPKISQGKGPKKFYYFSYTTGIAISYPYKKVEGCSMSFCLTNDQAQKLKMTYCILHNIINVFIRPCYILFICLLVNFKLSLWNPPFYPFWIFITCLYPIFISFFKNNILIFLNFKKNVKIVRLNPFLLASRDSRPGLTKLAINNMIFILLFVENCVYYDAIHIFFGMAENWFSSSWCYRFQIHTGKNLHSFKFSYALPNYQKAALLTKMSWLWDKKLQVFLLFRILLLHPRSRCDCKKTS